MDVDAARIEKRLKTRYLDRMTHSYAEALAWILDAKKAKKALSVGLVGNIGTTFKSFVDGPGICGCGDRPNRRP